MILMIWLIKAFFIFLICAIAMVIVLIAASAIRGIRDQKHREEKLPFCCLLQDGKKCGDPYGKCIDCRIFKDFEKSIEKEAQEENED